MNAGLKSKSTGGRLRRAALAWVICNFLIGAAASQAAPPYSGGTSSSAQRFAAQMQALQEARRRSRVALQGTLVPRQGYIVQRPTPAPYLVTTPHQPHFAFYDAALGIRGITVPGFGIQVLGVTTYLPGYNLGLEPGDIIVRINNRPVQSAHGLRLALSGWHGAFRVLVLDVRTGTYQTRWGQLY